MTRCNSISSCLWPFLKHVLHLRPPNGLSFIFFQLFRGSFQRGLIDLKSAKSVFWLPIERNSQRAYRLTQVSFNLFFFRFYCGRGSPLNLKFPTFIATFILNKLKWAVFFFLFVRCLTVWEENRRIRWRNWWPFRATSRWTGWASQPPTWSRWLTTCPSSSTRRPLWNSTRSSRGRWRSTSKVTTTAHNWVISSRSPLSSDLNAFSCGRFNEIFLGHKRDQASAGHVSPVQATGSADLRVDGLRQLRQGGDCRTDLRAQRRSTSFDQHRRMDGRRRHSEHHSTVSTFRLVSPPLWARLSVQLCVEFVTNLVRCIEETEDDIWTWFRNGCDCIRPRYRSSKLAERVETPADFSPL